MDLAYINGYRFLYFSKNFSKYLSSRYEQKIFDSTKASATDPL